MLKPTPRNLAYRAECPHSGPCWCADCKRAYSRVRNRLTRAPATPQLVTTTCPWCWKSFQRNVKKGQRYCSQVCSQRTRSQLTIWHAIDRCHLPHCEDCGQVGGFNPFSAFICSGCSFERSKLRRHEGEAKRQAAMRAGDRSINWRGLGDRDNWICHLCRRSVPKQVGTPKKKNGATVDHLDPLSDGGPHQWENVALAHWSCNISRGARASEHGVQLRLIG